MYVTSVAATAVNFAKRMSEPLSRPTPMALSEHQREPEHPDRG